MNWMRINRAASWVALVLAVLVIIGAWSMASAQGNNCFPREVVLTQLAEKYGETRRGVGLTNDGKIFEVWASEGGSWTATVTMPNGMMCVAGAGQAFSGEAVKPNL